MMANEDMQNDADTVKTVRTLLESIDTMSLAKTIVENFQTLVPVLHDLAGDRAEKKGMVAAAAALRIAASRARSRYGSSPEEKAEFEVMARAMGRRNDSFRASARREGDGAMVFPTMKPSVARAHYANAKGAK